MCPRRSALGASAGSGLFCYREPPRPEQLTEPLVDVPVTLDACPSCGGPAGRGTHRLCLYNGHSSHPSSESDAVSGVGVPVHRVWRAGARAAPDVAPDQYGATAHRVGDRAMAAAHGLHYGVGMPVRKVPKVLEALTGLS